MKQPKTHHVILYGMPATGATLTEAKQHALAQIEAALTADYTPIMLHERGVSFVGAYTPLMGWVQWIQAEGRARLTCVYGTEATRAHVEDSLRRHLAQYTSTVDDTEPPACLVTEAQRHEWYADQRCQQTYQRVRAQGLDAREAHRQAVEAMWDYSRDHRATA